MKRNTLLLAAVFMLGTMCSCGGNASSTNEEVEETTMQETTEEIVESEDNENTVEAESEAEDAATDVVEEMIDRKNVEYNPKYDKILDNLEKKVAELKDKSGKIGKEVGLIHVQNLQVKIQNEMDKIDVSKLTAEQYERYQELVTDMTMVTLESAGGLLDALF
jgi:hypothetical protein